MFCCYSQENTVIFKAYGTFKLLSVERDKKSRRKHDLEESLNAILDTDFLLFCAENRIDYASEFSRLYPENLQLSIVDKTLDELEHFAARGGKSAALVKLVKTILRLKNVSVITTSKQGIVDDLIVSLANTNSVVATQDLGLKRRLRLKGTQIVTVRKKSHLLIE